MINLYIDESGTMNNKCLNEHKYFVITMVKIEDKIGFKHIFKKSLRKFKKEIIPEFRNLAQGF